MSTLSENIKYDPRTDWDPEEYVNKYKEPISDFMIRRMDILEGYLFTQETTPKIIKYIIKQLKNQSGSIQHEFGNGNCKARFNNEGKLEIIIETENDQVETHLFTFKIDANGLYCEDKKYTYNDDQYKIESEEYDSKSGNKIFSESTTYDMSIASKFYLNIWKAAVKQPIDIELCDLGYFPSYYKREDSASNSVCTVTYATSDDCKFRFLSEAGLDRKTDKLEFKISDSDLGDIQYKKKTALVREDKKGKDSKNCKESMESLMNSIKNCFKGTFGIVFDSVGETELIRLINENSYTELEINSDNLDGGSVDLDWITNIIESAIANGVKVQDDQVKALLKARQMQKDKNARQ